MIQKFKAGDKVRVIKYGSKMWYSKAGYAQQSAAYKAFGHYLEAKVFYNSDLDSKDYPVVVDENVKPSHILSEDENVYICDWQPQLVGMEGVVEKCVITQGIPGYSLSGINGKSAWYDEEQLELI